jgi:hypothetical protein
MLRRIFLFLWITALASAATLDLAGNAHDPFRSLSKVKVFVFLRTDCPIGNRYAAELRRIFTGFADQSMDFWIVYPDPAETPDAISRHFATFGFPGKPLRDPRHELVKRSHVVAAPEVAVFDSEDKLIYHGRIDDLWVSAGIARPMVRDHDLQDAISAVLEGHSFKPSEIHGVGCPLADVK